MRIKLSRPKTPLWRACVDLVRKRYATEFGADVEPSPDAFLAVCSPESDQVVAACAGITFASSRPLFSEKYLDEPIEQAIGRKFGAEPARARIVEVGSLASAVQGAGSELMRFTPLFVWCLGMEYILCTSTSTLSGALKRLNIPFTPLQAAERGRLESAQQSRWGSYYEAAPCAGVIPLNGLAALFANATGRYSFFDPEMTLLPADYEPLLPLDLEAKRAPH